MKNFKDIKTFEDALAITGESPEQFAKRTEHDDECELAGKKLAVIYKAANDGKEGVYYPYFWRESGSGSRFSCRDYLYEVGNVSVGARLKGATREIAIYVGKQFIDLYNDYLNG